MTARDIMAQLLFIHAKYDSMQLRLISFITRQALPPHIGVEMLVRD